MDGRASDSDFFARAERKLPNRRLIAAIAISRLARRHDFWFSMWCRESAARARRTAHSSRPEFQSKFEAHPEAAVLRSDGPGCRLGASLARPAPCRVLASAPARSWPARAAR